MTPLEGRMGGRRGGEGGREGEERWRGRREGWRDGKGMNGAMQDARRKSGRMRQERQQKRDVRVQEWRSGREEWNMRRASRPGCGARGGGGEGGGLGGGRGDMPHQGQREAIAGCEQGEGREQRPPQDEAHFVVEVRY